jgi:hypothetical protein
MDIYKVFQRTFEGTSVVAIVEGTDISGEKAPMVRSILESRNWPEVSPMDILYGSYLFAVESTHSPIV